MASKIGKALGYSMDLGETPREKSLGLSEGDLPKVDTRPADMDSGLDEDNGPDSSAEEETAPATAEVMAMKMFTRASTPEAKADALKAFLEACGAITGSY